MKKTIFLIFGIVTLLAVFVIFIFSGNKKSGLFTKDYYIGIVTVQGDNKPEINFMDKSLENIGKIYLDAKDFLRVFNYNKVEQDKDSFYFVQDSSIFSNNNDLLKVDKKNFKQTKLKVNNYPSYFHVGEKNIYTVEILLGASNIGVFDKEKNTPAKNEKINKTLSPSIFEYKSDLYYYINDNNKVTLYNHMKKKSELSIEGINEVLYTYLNDDTAYILGKYIEDNEKGQISEYILTKYNFKTKKKSNIIIPNKDYKYVFADLILVNDKIILQEDVNLVAFRNKKDLLYIDMNRKQVKSISLDEYPQSISLDRKSNVIFVSKNSISIYNKDFKLIKHKKINIIKEKDYERKFNSHVLIGWSYEKSKLLNIYNFINL